MLFFFKVLFSARLEVTFRVIFVHTYFYFYVAEEVVTSFEQSVYEHRYKPAKMKELACTG